MTLGVPNLFYVFLAVAVAMASCCDRMGYGRRLYAVGTNRLGGHPERDPHRPDGRSRATCLCGIASAFVGILLGGYTDMSDQKIGEGYDLDTIAVAVLGGAAIGGGSGQRAGDDHRGGDHPGAHQPVAADGLPHPEPDGDQGRW